jgi:hypothetical protein
MFDFFDLLLGVCDVAQPQIETNMFLEHQFQRYLKSGGVLAWPTDEKMLPAQLPSSSSTDDSDAPAPIPLKPLLFVGGNTAVNMPSKAVAYRQVWYRLDRVDQEYSLDMHVMVQENASTLTRRAVRRLDRVNGTILMNPRYESHATAIPDGDIDGSDDTTSAASDKKKSDFVRELLSTASTLEKPSVGTAPIAPRAQRETKQPAIGTVSVMGPSASPPPSDTTTGAAAVGGGPSVVETMTGGSIGAEILVCQGRIDDLTARLSDANLSSTAEYGLKKQLMTQKAMLIRLRKRAATASVAP